MLNYFNFLAGVALILYGIRAMRRGTERLCGARLRQILQKATRSNLRSLAAGVLLSILTPSSTGVALLSEEAIVAGYVSVAQVLAVMLGANIGFTITVQLLAFKFYLWNTVFLAIGVPLFLFGKRPAVRGTGQTLLGIGFLFLAIQVLSTATVALKTNADVGEVMRLLASHPVWLAAFATVLELLLQSPTATIGLGLALCAQGVLPVNGAVAVVLGANVGVGVTALLTGFARADTRRMAVGNLCFKVVGVAVCLPLVAPLVQRLRPLSPLGDAQLIANADTLFNVAVAVVFLPLVAVAARLLERIIPTPTSDTEPVGPRYLDPAALASPALALGQATREILRMADQVQAMLRGAHRAFQAGDLSRCDQVQKADDQVDALNNDIKNFITRLSEQALSREESRREIALLGFATELEIVGDIIDKNLMDLARKRITLKVQFSKEGGAELEDFFGKVLETFEMAVSAFASQDRNLATKLVQHKHRLGELERELRSRHFHRLHAGLVESFETSAIHLDVLTYLKAINSHLTSVAYPILEAQRH